MKIALLGYGKMGRMVEEAARRQQIEVACRIDPAAGSQGSIEDCDVCIDFSEPSAVVGNISRVADAGLAMVVGTTGWYDRIADVRRIVDEKNIGFVYGSNFSLGVNLMFRIADYAARLFSQFSSHEPFIEEAHHQFKKDAPSGTGIFLLREVQAHYGRKVPVASLRAGFIPGIHTVGFDSEADTLSITHNARSRAGFAEGAIIAAQWIHGKRGFYEFSEVIDEQLKESDASSAWDRFFAAHKVGDRISGKVTGFAKYGAVVEIAGGIEGLCHMIDLSEKQLERPEDGAAIGDVLSFKILNIDPANKKVRLSAIVDN
jgi:4-hydroxy-tetrahydrodipicolinate reductase